MIIPAQFGWRGHPNPCRQFFRGSAELSGIGHRVVHGGERFRAPVRIDVGVVEALDRLPDDELIGDILLTPGDWQVSQVNQGVREFVQEPRNTRSIGIDCIGVPALRPM